MKCLSAAELRPRPKRADDGDTALRQRARRATYYSSRTKEHSFLLTATRFMRRLFEAARGEAARAYRQRSCSWSLRGLEHRRAGSCCAS